MSGYQSFYKSFRQKTFVSSKVIASKFKLQNALASNYILPSFFKGVYYVPSQLERKGQFIEKPAEFFADLFNFLYGRNGWYWALTTAARYYGLEWSSGKVLEIVVATKSKKIDIAARVASLGNKKSYRSKVLSRILSALGINFVIIHKGRKDSLKEVKIDSEIGPVATKSRMMKDIEIFLSKTKMKSLRRLYRAIIAKA